MSEPNEPSRREFLRWLSLSGLGAAAGLTAVPLIPSTATAHNADILALTNATVIDGVGHQPLRDQTVVISGDRIIAVGPGPRVPLPLGVTTVDLRGKFIIPGLWDMHTHGTSIENIFPPLYLAHGVTGVREMFGSAAAQATRARIENGTLAGPRMVIGSPIIDQPPTVLGPGAILVETPAQARAAVRQSIADGADFIKIYSYLSRDLFQAIADEARRQHVPIAGHLPYKVTAHDATNAGMRSYEHMFGVATATSRDEDAINRLIARTPIVDATAYFYAVRELEWQAVDSYSRSRASAFYDHLARRGSWMSPTLMINRVVNSPAETYADDPRLRYLPRSYRDSWPQRIKIFAPATPEHVVAQRKHYEFLLRAVGEMHRAGVGILSGTDCGAPYSFPGFGLHDDLELLVEAGLSEMAAIKAATSEATRYLGLERRHGTVTPGKAADLVVLDADPLRDIRNTTKIHAVVARGQLITSTQRTRMLADVAEQASASFTATATTAAADACGCHAMVASKA